MDKPKGCKPIGFRFAMLKFHGAISVFTEHLIEQKSSHPIFYCAYIDVAGIFRVYFSRIGALRIPTSENMQSSVRKISKTTDRHAYGAGESTEDLAHFYRKSARGTLDFLGIASTFAMFLHSMPDQVRHDVGSMSDYHSNNIQLLDSQSFRPPIPEDWE